MNRSPNGINIHRFLEGYGIRVLPYHLKRDPRPKNVIYGGREVGRLMRKDIERTGLTVRCIQIGNPTCFDDIYLWSVWRVLAVHFSQSKPADAIEAFACVDLAEIRNRAQRLVIGQGGAITKTTAAISLELARDILTREQAA